MVKHVNRELNSEAHNLASLAKIAGTKFWLGDGSKKPGGDGHTQCVQTKGYSC